MFSNTVISQTKPPGFENAPSAPRTPTAPTATFSRSHESPADSPSSQQGQQGRGADEHLTQRILKATVSLVTQTGYEGLRMEAVARLAQCGKPAIYRRYANKAELVAAAVLSVVEPSDAPDTGSVEGDLLEHIMTTQHNSALLTRADPDAIGLTAAFEPAVFELLWERLFKQRHQRGMALIMRGVERGQITPDVDADALVDVLAGFTLYRQTVKHIDINEQQYREIIAAIVAQPPLKAA
ncbi:MAG: TetR/AcrR family transcriptional regulator [Bifidobacterium tibiigranuli]|jgi:AcrR family transcriptional regulator|uniref:TetR/AcrR family transcriptional regulator n=1 Tax=Bifidobacterium tibiigranuli TaxID=2172043 RepID=UPI0023535387|nr:TetR/AcrR family transcriptional regulator [Bifidobacterium tibiigranuli]MCH3974375.1 TetR/AcrR family transcriptional regulator [Bifidobacterium tibiigranuli]MCH4190036.1 TetR/AcrR family transcriptional regulator [Bifidobacterium tibiigranuli]MCH4204691.1 TetR/AcrR family transcriptional regulator [Bifidobacterium tibiigranuli]MCH4275459.1 TetR/AcrR family transcriptional regulator [Bifidobacterium tibiigranuli]MCI1792231.1 TetR/AcrR family transcriptional regulator [Bifidobacterium tibii